MHSLYWLNISHNSPGLRKFYFRLWLTSSAKSHRDTIPNMRHLILHLSSFILILTACAPSPTPATPPPPSGTVLFQDDFDSPATGWDRFINDGGIVDYYEGAYRILVRLPGMNFWSTPEQNFRDVRVEADVLKVGGPDENRMGIMCRYQAGNYYFFIISDDGYYSVGKFINNQTTLLGQTEMQASEFIQPGLVNHLRADCIGDTLTFYVNYHEVASVTDADLDSGDVGVLAGSFLLAGVDVVYDHFVVMQP